MAGSSSFDGQAASFDARTGLPPEARRGVARGAIDLAGIERPRVLELGAGTGEIGVELAALAGHYLGLDSSRAMLDQFRARDGAAELELVEGDANARWPVDERSVELVFASRSIHLLSADHVLEELDRVARPGACLVVGRVQRDAHNPQERLRRELQHRLAERGYSNRRGHAGTSRLLSACAERGWDRLPPREVARWTIRWRPADSLRAWADRPGSSEVERAVVGQVETWARGELGDLDAAHESVQVYALQAARCPRATF